jgi:MHS family proline/betaine transporter-like MFS transporter
MTSGAQRRIMVAGVAGNVLEWYDFALYGYLAPITAQLFFPSTEPLSALINTYAVFALGFLARPLGGLLLGRVGDRLGRRHLLTLSVTAMAVPTFLIGLLPTYASIGLWAPVLLATLRLMQGLSAGGKFTGSIVYLVEQAPLERRGFYGSLANAGAIIGGLLGAGCGWLTTTLVPGDALQDWGWRLPFLTGLAVGALGLWLRVGVPETPTHAEFRANAGKEHASLGNVLRGSGRRMLLTAGLNWVASAGYYVVFVWFVTDMTQVIGLPYRTALGIGTIGLAVGLIATLGMGALSDRVGQRRLLAIGAASTMILAVPLLMLAATGGLPAIMLAQFALAVLVAVFLGTLPTVFVSLHDTATRCTNLALGYNAALALFGGTAPLVATLLVKATGWPAAPGLYLVATALVCPAPGA